MRQQRADARPLAGGVDADDQSRAEVGGAGVDRVALAHRQRHGLAGEHGVVERRPAREHDAVDRHQFAGADLDAVARHERRQRHFDHGRVGAVAVEPPRELEERDAAQAVGALERRPLGAALQLPGAEQGRDQHRQRVEPERAAAA